MWAFPPVEAASKTPRSLETSLRVMITVVSLGVAELSAAVGDAAFLAMLACRQAISGGQLLQPLHPWWCLRPSTRRRARRRRLRMSPRRRCADWSRLPAADRTFPRLEADYSRYRRTLR